MSGDMPREHSSDPAEGTWEETAQVTQPPAFTASDTGYDEGAGDRVSPSAPPPPSESATDANQESIRHLPADMGAEAETER